VSDAAPIAERLAAIRARVAAAAARAGRAAEAITVVGVAKRHPAERVVEAVAAGEVSVGFVNHYYLYQFLAEDPDYPVRNKIYGGGDPGGLVNVAGAGILETAGNVDEANAFIDFLLSTQAQTYFAEETFEIPVADDVQPVDGVPTLAEVTLATVDLNELDDLAGTLELLTELGIV